MSIENIVLIAIIVSCVVFIGVCLIRRRPDLLVDFVLRASIGTVSIYILDVILRMKGYDISVGVNGVSIITNGLLGLPGFLLLYGLSIYYTY